MSVFESRKGKSSGRSARGHRRPIQRRRPLWLERLEDRTLPSTITWMAGSGNWNVGSNWSTGSVPGTGDTAVIDTGSTAATITIPSGDNVQVQAVSSTANDTLSIAGTLTVTSGASALAGPLQVSDATLAATGSGVSLTASGATTDFESSLEAESGAALSLPQLTNTVTNHSNFQAGGASSVLDVSALTTVTDEGSWSVDASNGGEIKLNGLSSLNSPGEDFSIEDTGGSTILDPNLKTLNGVSATLDGTNAHVADSWTSFLVEQLTVTTGSYTLPGLTDVDESNLVVLNGGSLALPGLTSTVTNHNKFQAEGAGSVLDVSALTAVIQQGLWSVEASNGGEIKLNGLSSLNSPGEDFSIEDTGGSTILDPNLKTLNGVNATLDGTDAHVADSWTSFTGGELEVTVGSYTLPGLTDVDGSNLTVVNGGSLSLPGLTSYATGNSLFEARGELSVLDVSALATVTDQGSWKVESSNGGEINLNGLTSLNSPDEHLSIEDTGNSAILDPNLKMLNGVSATLDGTDTAVANAWTTLTNGNLYITGGTLTLPNLTSLAGSGFSLSTGITASFPVLTVGAITLANGQSITIQGVQVDVPADGTSGATLDVPASQGLSITFENIGTFTGGTVVNVGQGSTATFFGGTYLGGVTFNVASGGTANLIVPKSGPGSAGAAAIFGGTLTGSGGGTVVLDGSDFRGGGISPATGGMTLDFPAGMFQWQEGWIFGRSGNVTNQGVLNLTGADDMILAEDGTLFNYGTIIQTGTANLVLDEADNLFPTELVNEAGASYLISSDTGITSSDGGAVAVQNAGNIIATAGTGTATLAINGPLTNSGTIAVDSGTLNLAPTSISQLSSGSLTGGTWNALNGATLAFPSGTAITSSAASLSLEGSGASITGLSGLASNSGLLSIMGGARLATTGNFTNTGTLTVGAGSTLTVGGSFTQTSAGSLDVQIGGAPGSGPFSQVVAGGTATLAGAFNLGLVNGYTPQVGQLYSIITFASASGNFTSFTGLSPYFTESLTATAQELTVFNSPVDLVTSNVSAPTTATAGQTNGTSLGTSCSAQMVCDKPIVQLIVYVSHKYFYRKPDLTVPH